MSETSWVLNGVDPEIRQRAIEEAERLGVPLSEYLTDVVLRAALAEEAPDPQATAPAPGAPHASQENFPGRYRVEAPERRFGVDVEALDSAVRTLDRSVYGLAARVDDAEALAGATVERLARTMQDAGEHLAALHQRVASAEEQTEALGRAQASMGEAFAARSMALLQRAAAAEDAARAASGAAAELASQYEALKYAVADDFSAFAQDSAGRLSAALDDVRAAADSAAEEARAAVSQLVQELRTLSSALETGLRENAAEARERVQAAFDEATERVNALAVRVADCELLAARGAERLNAQIADVEDRAQAAIEATAETLRQAGAALAAEFARATHDTRKSLENVHHDLTAEIAAVRDQQAFSAARLSHLDAASEALASEVGGMRRTMDARAVEAEEAVRAVLARAQAEWDGRHAALRADSERIEACALAALEAVANDRAAGDAALHRELADVRDQGSDALAHLALLERAIGRDLLAAVEAGAAPVSGRLEQIETALADRSLDERLSRLEATQGSEGTDHALAALRGQVGALAARFDALQIEGAQDLDDMRARTGQAQERLHTLERTVADLKLERPDAAAAGGGEALHDIERRVAEFEQRQEAAIAQLRADIAGFIDDHARRLEGLEQTAPSAVTAEFEALRRRIEERILDVEQRSVRALEQAADTMAGLEQRFNASPEAMLRSA
jgi:hypothetical protein